MTWLCSVPTTSLTRIVAVSPARNVRSLTSSAENPPLVTVTLYVPVSGSAAMVADPSSPVVAPRDSPVWLLTADTVASFTTAPLWSTATMTMVEVLGDCASA